MSRSSVTNIALSMSAGCLATLITACGTGGGQVGQITEAHEVAKSASPIARPAGPASYDVDDVVTWRKQKMAQDWVDRRSVTGHDGELDPAQRRYLAGYFSERAMSDVWQRHPELLRPPADTIDREHPSAGPGRRGHTVDPYRQDPNTSAEAWTRRLKEVQGTCD